jgi:ParB-like nuclease family protein
MDSGERTIRIETVRIPRLREGNGSCMALAHSIRDEGLHRPITVWKDSTLISGQRRLVAHMLLGHERIQAVFVGTIEDAAKRMLGDNQDDKLALAWKWSEVCRLWEVLRRLDEPAAVRRADAARRRGVELRRKTQAGQRKAGRASNHSEDYVLKVICEPFGISSATARRIETIYHLGYGTKDAPDDKRELAREVMADIDNGGSVWANYQRLMGVRGPVVAHPKTVAAVEPAPTARQTTAWAKSLPQMEGLVSGLAELGPPNPELTWEQVGPVHTRLMAVRRELEKIIKQMRESNKS